MYLHSVHSILKMKHGVKRWEMFSTECLKSHSSFMLQELYLYMFFQARNYLFCMTASVKN